MDQYLPRDSEVLLGESSDLPLLAMPMTPRPIVKEMVLGSAVGSAAPSVLIVSLSLRPYVVCRTCPERAPLMFIRTLRSRGPLHVCQYRMTSYDEGADRSEFSPAYGIHLHDPRLLEYVGAPESA